MNNESRKKIQYNKGVVWNKVWYIIYVINVKEVRRQHELSILWIKYIYAMNYECIKGGREIKRSYAL